jgi:M6 family metalloprotease-like protein
MTPLERKCFVAMVRLSAFRQNGVRGDSANRSLASMLVVLATLILSNLASPIAVAAQNRPSHKHAKCIGVTTQSLRHMACATKAKVATKKVPATLQIIATTAPAIVTPPLSTPSVEDGIQPAAQPTLASRPPSLLNTNSPSCKLPTQNTRGDVEIGFPRITNRAPSVGVIRAAMIFVDFSDASATIDPKTLYSYFDSTPPMLKQMSYGKANLQITPDLQWFRMTRTTTSYQQDLQSGFSGLRSFMSEAIALASTSVDFRKVDVFYVVSNPAATNIVHSMAFVARPGYAITAGNASLSNGVLFGADWPSEYAMTLVHETSHTFGLVDDYNADFDPRKPNDAFRFTGDFSIMSTLYGTAPEYLAWEAWLMGWLDDSQVECLAPGNSVVTLQALETPGGVKVAVIPISMTRALFVESRRPIAADARLPGSGALVYTVDTSIASAHGPLKVIGGTPALHLTDALLALNGQVTVGNIKLTIIGSTSTTDTINVNVG